MSPSLLLVPRDITNQRGRPLPGFSIECLLTNREADPLALLRLAATVRLAEPSMVPVQGTTEAEFLNYPAVFRPGESHSVFIPIVFAREVLDTIEGRGRRDGELEFIVTPNALVAPIVKNGATEVMGPPESAYIESKSADGRSGGLKISRDRWVALLKQFGYSGLEVFELPAMRLREAGLHERVVGALRQAEAALRDGRWGDVLTKTREAFEAMATATVQKPDVKAGFETLWQRLLPNLGDEDKRKALNATAASLADLQHLGRHAKFPSTELDRREALLAFRTTLALFEYIGARLPVPAQ